MELLEDRVSVTKLGKTGEKQALGVKQEFDLGLAELLTVYPKKAWSWPLVQATSSHLNCGNNSVSLVLSWSIFSLSKRSRGETGTGGHQHWDDI